MFKPGLIGAVSVWALVFGPIRECAQCCEMGYATIDGDHMNTAVLCLLPGACVSLNSVGLISEVARTGMEWNGS